MTAAPPIRSMRSPKLAVVSLAVGIVSLAIACSTTSGADGVPDGCCPPSPEPSCCMDYGGYGAGLCGPVCDRMPVSTDPGWTLATDGHGCSVWRNPNDGFRGGIENPDTRYCGAPSRRIDAGADVGVVQSCPLASALDVTSRPYAPPLTAPGACTEEEVKALSDYLTANAEVTAISEWSKQVSAQCSAGVFSDDGHRWAPILVEDDAILRLNHGGCIELQTGKESCGRAYQQLIECHQEACSECSLLPELLDCLEDTATLSAGPCKAAFDAVAASCGEDLTAAEKACEGADWPFEGPIRVQCVAGAGTDAGGG
jgi:hypothetical protein